MAETQPSTRRWWMVLESASQPATNAMKAHSAIDVRLVLFAIQHGELSVAVAQSYGDWELPGVSLTVGESLDAAALRALRQLPGLEHRYIEQLYSVAIEEAPLPSAVIAYLGLADADVSGPGVEGATWQRALQLPEISALDAKIVDYALVRLRAKLGYTTIAFHLLPMTFSLSELQQVYEI